MRRVRRSVLVGLALLSILIPAGMASSAAASRIDMMVLVVSDGGPTIAAIAQAMTAEGVAHRTVDLTATDRPVINDAFLADTVAGPARAKYQAIVLPNENPFANPEEMSAIARYEQRFGIPQVDAYVYASPAVGLNYPGYLGPLDGITAGLTPAAATTPFPYLAGPVRLEDNDPLIWESYGFLASPLPDDPAGGRSFTQLLTGPVPGGGGTGTLIGVYNHDGRSELVLTFAYNQFQRQFRLLAHGIITWMTRGIHLGYSRNYLSLHIDDVFGEDSRWNMDEHCTPGSDCPPAVPEGQAIRMTAADVTYAKQWQDQNDVTFDMYYDGPGAPDGTLPGRLAGQLRTREQVRLGALDTYRDFVDVRDVADAVVAAAVIPSPLPPILNIGSGRATAVRDLVKTLIEVAGTDPHVLESAPGSTRSAEVPWQRAEISAAEKALGWHPTRDLTTSLRDLWAQSG